MKNLKEPKKERTHSLKMQFKRVSSSQRTLTLRQYSIPSTWKNSHLISISPGNPQIPLYASIKTSPCYVIHKCHKYGHTKTRCWGKLFCRKCREEDQTSDKTNQCPNESKCVNCREGHVAGSNNCEVEKKKGKLKNASRQQSGKTGSSSNPGERWWVSKIKPSIISYTFHMQNGTRK